MNKFAHYLLIGFLLNFIGTFEAQAAIQIASSCSESAIQSAINIASDGDTVSVPPGNCTWKGSVTIPSTKGITLQGSGSVDRNGNYSSSGTFITLNSLALEVTTSASGNSPVRITGFHFTHNHPNSASAAVIMYGKSVGYRTGATNWRVDHNFFQYNNPGDLNVAGPGVTVKGWTYGVIDHNVFNFHGRALFVQMGNDDWEPGKNQYYGDGSWNTSIGGPIDWGGPKAVYIEDNWFHGNRLINSNQLIDSAFGSRIVIRYNKINDMQIQSHSGCSNGHRSTLHQEIYNNQFTSSDSGVKTWSALFIRGGTFVFHNNTITGTYASHPNSFIIDYQHGTDGCNACASPLYPVGQCTYPCFESIGMGADATGSGKTSDPVYAWGNLHNLSPASITKGYCGVNDIIEGRDYFNNTVKPGYSPYTYPHPLTTGGIQEKQQLPTDAPAIPKNLIIKQ